MDTGERSRPEVRPSSDVDARPVMLVLADDTIGSLASLLLAADIARAQRGRLHVAHVSPPPVWTGMPGRDAGAGQPAGRGRSCRSRRPHEQAPTAESRPGQAAARSALDRIRDDFGVVPSQVSRRKRMISQTPRRMPQKKSSTPKRARKSVPRVRGIRPGICFPASALSEDSALLSV